MEACEHKRPTIRRGTALWAIWVVALVALLALGACSRSNEATSGGESPSVAQQAAQAGPAAPTKAAAPVATPPAAPAVPSDVPETVEGANVTMGSATVNGLAATNVKCRTSGQMFAATTILGSLAQQKQTFQGCSTKNETVRLHFVVAGTTASDVRVAGASDPAVSRCVADALAATTFASPCACVLSIQVGPPAAP